MIPKIIHYCWFGKGQKSKLHEQCIASWKKYCPEYQIIEWNEDNYDVNSIPYISAAYKEKKWGFVTDYARLDLVYTYGGIYLDTDVELIRGLDTLLSNECYFGIERENNYINTGIGFGAEKNNSVIKELMDAYRDVSFYEQNGELNLVPCTYYTTRYFEKGGFVRKDFTQKISNVVIYASDYFCPMDYETRKLFLTNDTISIHWFDASWYTKEDRHIYEVGVAMHRILPGMIARFVHFFWAYLYRASCYAKEGKLLYVIKERLKEIIRRV